MSKEKPTTTSADTESFPLVKKGKHFNVLDLLHSSESMETGQEQHSDDAGAVPAETSRNATGLSENQVELAIIKEGQPMLDGVMCLGRTWNFVQPPRKTKIYDEPSVVVRPAAYYNGLPEVTKFPFRYEIPFADIEEATLSLLIVSKYDKRRLYPVTNWTDQSQLAPLNFNLMAYGFIDLIGYAIEGTDGKTLQRFNQMEPGLIIYQREWEWVGDLLVKQLKKSCRRANSVPFPLGAKFYFLLKQSGQNLAYVPTERFDYHPPVSMESSYLKRLALCVAVDFEHGDDKKILLFNSKFAEPLQCRPDYKYNPCLVPETGDYVYSNLPPNAFNVLALRQYTRLFQAIHRNKNGFFHKPFIADTILTNYLKHLNDTYEDDDYYPHLNEILEPSLAELRDATIESLKSSTPIKSRFEFVWSRDLSVDQPTSFENYQSQAVDDCLQFMRTSHCANTSLFKVHRRDQISEYLTYQLNTFFDTILSAVEAIRPKVLAERPNNIDPDSPSLTLEDFAAVFLSEAMISRLTRGTFDGFPDFLCELVFQELNTERSILKWPFDEHKMREQQGLLLVRDISVTKCFPKLDIPNLILIHSRKNPQPCGVYKKFVLLPITAPDQSLASATCDLLTEIIDHFLQKLLLHNFMQPAIKDEALRKIWKSGALQHHLKAETHSTSSLYVHLFELSTKFFCELQIPLLMLEIAKMELVAKFRGGADLSVAMIMDDLMYKAGVPFILRSSERIIQLVFVPYTLPQTKSPEPIIGIYQEAFKISFGRNKGRAGIHVDKFLVPLVFHIQSLKMDYRPKDMNPIFKLVNKFLDNDNAKRSSAFAKLSADIKEILLSPYNVRGEQECTQLDAQKAREVAVSNELDLFLENILVVDDAELVNTERSPVASCSSVVASQTIASNFPTMSNSTERSEASIQDLTSHFNDVTIHNSIDDDDYGDDEGCEDPSILLRGYLFRRNRQFKTYTLCDNIVFEGDSFM